jgi:hypothetical protein
VKKNLVLLLMGLLASSMLFAEVTVSGWGRGIFAPVAVNGDEDATTWIGTSWSDGETGGDPRIGFTVSGTSEDGTIGVQGDFNVDGTAVSVGDQRKIWVKPIEALTCVIGVAYDDTLRGNGAYGGFNWIRAYGNAWTGEGYIFERAQTDVYGTYGAMVMLDVAGLHGVASFAGLDEADTTQDMFGNAQYQVGYTIDGVGLVRAGLKSFADETGYYEAAFKVTAVENLTADFGLRFPQNSDYTDEGDAYDAKVAAYLNYVVSDATIHGLVDVQISDSDYVDESDDYQGLDLTFGAGLDYGLSDSLGLCADVRYTKSQDGSDGVIGGTLGVSQGFSNGKLGVGVQGYNDGSDSYVALPIVFEYWF